MKQKLILASLLTCTACVAPYEEQFTTERTIFIVDGILSNDAIGNYVKLSEANPINEGLGTTYIPVENAKVKVLANGNTEINLTETEPGYYSFPENFKGEIGNTYKLQFNTENGKYFESMDEEMNAVAEIKNVYHSYNDEAIKTATETSPGYMVYVDTQDPSETEDFYMWEWSLYEQQFYCKTCYNTLYFNDNTTGPLGECKGSFGRQEGYDYSCSNPCWDIIPSRKTNIMNDEFSNGQEIKARLVAELPIYQKIGSLLEIRQYGINREVYNFQKLASTLGDKTGGLADTPPATLAGNITSPEDPLQPVAGYFIVSSVAKTQYWLDKLDLPNSTQTIGLFNGRKVEPEPMNVSTERPPMAPCVNTQFRTSIQPFGWKQI